MTLARQPTAVKRLGDKGAGQAGRIAAPQILINAIPDVLASLSIHHARSPGRGRLNLLGRVAVGVGNYLHQVTIGVVEIHAATTV